MKLKEFGPPGGTSKILLCRSTTGFAPNSGVGVPVWEILDPPRESLPPATNLLQGNVLHLSVILFTGCVSLSREGSLSRGVSVQGSLSREGSLSRGISVQGSLSREGSLSRGISVQGDLCPEGLCPRGLCPEGGFSVQGVSVQGGFSVQGVSVWRISVQVVLCPGGSLLGVPPWPLYRYVRAVRILLECILVIDHFSAFYWRIFIEKFCQPRATEFS